MDKSFKGIVIKSKDYGEADKLVTLLTVEQGRIVVKAKSVKKPKAKLKFATEPFCFGDFEVASSRGIPVLTGCELIELFYELRGNIDKFYLANSLLEFIDNITKDSQDCSQEVIFLVRALENIVNYKGELSVLAVKLLYLGLQSSGYGFNDFRCERCDCEIEGTVFFNVGMGQFFCESCRAENPQLNIKMVKRLEKIVKTDVNDLQEIDLKRDEILPIIRFIAKYTQYKFEFSNLSLIQYMKML